MPISFDAAYFRRYYESRRSRVYSEAQVDHLARGVTGFIQWFGGTIDDVLDVGAGTGLWGQWFRANMKDAQYQSVDVSEYACKTYGHERRDISKWRSRRKYDLIVCQGVLPYLSEEQCAKAIANMAAMCKGFLYLEAITSRDLADVCDRSRTDVRVFPHSRAFYRRSLRPWFEPLGCGLHFVRGCTAMFYELERG